MTVDISAEPWRQILRSSQQLYLAVSGKDGPLVTPELFTVADRRLWCLTSRTTAKAKLLSDGDRVTVAVRSGDGSAVIGAVVSRFDLMDPGSLMGKLGQMASAGSGLARFLSDNGYEMAGAAAAALTGKLGTPPPARLLLALEPRWAVAVSADGETSTAGDLAEPGTSSDSTGRTAPPELPGEVDAPDLHDGPVVVGWVTGWGAVALPGRWHAGSGVATVQTKLLDALDAPTASPASLCTDSWSGPGPLGKHGAMHRGQGWARPDGDTTEIVLDITRVVSWDGIDVTSTAV